MPWLRFSGDDDTVSPKGSPLFVSSMVESVIIYATPAVGFLAAYWFFFRRPVVNVLLQVAGVGVRC
jgi:hypothetical protein